MIIWSVWLKKKSKNRCLKRLLLYNEKSMFNTSNLPSNKVSYIFLLIILYLYIFKILLNFCHISDLFYLFFKIKILKYDIDHPIIYCYF